MHSWILYFNSGVKTEKKQKSKAFINIYLFVHYPRK